MAGTAWTEPELSWLLAHGDASHEQFLAAGFDRSYDAWRIMRQRAGKRHERLRLERMETPDGRLMGHQTVVDPPTDEDLEDFFRQIEDLSASKQALGTFEPTTDFFAPDDGLPVGIVFTGDWHCGAAGVDYPRLRADLDAVAATPGCYAVGMGDWVEGVTLDVKAAGSLFSGVMNEPGWQESYVLTRARLLQGRWVAILSGNHDTMVGRRTGITRMDQLAAELHAPHFTEGGGTIHVHVGGERYVVMVKHNHGAKALNTTNAQRRAWDELGEWELADVVVLAHLHFNDLQIATRKGQRVVYLRSGTYKTADSYARDHGWKSEVGTPLCIFLPGERKVIPFRGDDFLEGLAYLSHLRGGK